MKFIHVNTCPICEDIIPSNNIHYRTCRKTSHIYETGSFTAGFIIDYEKIKLPSYEVLMQYWDYGGFYIVHNNVETSLPQLKYGHRFYPKTDDEVANFLIMV